MKYAIIVAGGSGTRMKSSVPKQFLEIQGIPVLMHTITKFYSYNNEINQIVVLPQSQIDDWKQLVKNHQFEIPHQITTGGDTRYQSVKNGLMLVNESGLVAVHDGVRPLVSLETIDRCFTEAEKAGNAIPVIDVVDSVREITEEGNAVVDRSKLKQIQTPQVFRSDILISAYQNEFLPEFTDDASVLEKVGHSINLVEGNKENIKITTEIDLKIAEILL